MQAKDVMTHNVVTVTEDTPVHDIVRKLLQFRISAVPVIDGQDRVLGIVSESDLLAGEGENVEGFDRSWWLEALLEDNTVSFAKAHGSTAGAVMTRDVSTVSEDAPLTEIARTLERRHIKRVPVVRDGRLVGIVSRANLLHGLSNAIIDSHEPGAREDRALRVEVVNALVGRHELESQVINVIVSNGAVQLWGKVLNAEQKQAADSAAESVPGVKSLDSHILVVPIQTVPV